VLPNDASLGLHRAVGFEPVGIFKRGGHKFGAWHDVMWLQRTIRDSPLDKATAVR
jgi:L-amino acid N-acyltransferase YncA